MVKKGERSFWLTVGTFACIHPVTFLMLQSLALSIYEGMPLGKWLLMILLLPLLAFATSVTVMPVSLLAGAISAVWSRRTQSTVRFVLRAALASAVAVTFSYIPIYMILGMDIAPAVALLMIIPNAAIAGALSAWVGRRWRPRNAPGSVEVTEDGRSESASESLGREEAVVEPDVPDNLPVVSNKGSFLGVVLVFTAAGPLIAAIIFVLFSTAIIMAFGGSEAWAPALVSITALTLLLAPLGGISGLITGVVSSLISRGTSSRRRWLVATTMTGALASALSVVTVLLVFLMARSFGFGFSICLGLATMSVLGVIASLACGWICRDFRPRRVQFS